MMAELQAIAASIGAAVDIGKAAKSVSDFNNFAAAVADVNMKLIAVMTAATASLEKQSQLTARVAELEAELRTIRAWNTERSCRTRALPLCSLLRSEEAAFGSATVGFGRDISEVPRLRFDDPNRESSAPAISAIRRLMHTLSSTGVTQVDFRLEERAIVARRSVFGSYPSVFAESAQGHEIPRWPHRRDRACDPPHEGSRPKAIQRLDPRSG